MSGCQQGARNRNLHQQRETTNRIADSRMPFGHFQAATSESLVKGYKKETRLVKEG